MLAEVVRLVAQPTAGAFAGACVYILLVQQPVRMTTLSTPVALDDFRATIPRAERLQAPLLVVSLVAAAASLVLTFRWTTAVGAGLLLVVLALTLAKVLRSTGGCCPVPRPTASATPDPRCRGGSATRPPNRARRGRSGRLLV